MGNGGNREQWRGMVGPGRNDGQGSDGNDGRWVLVEMVGVVVVDWWGLAGNEGGEW